MPRIRRGWTQARYEVCLTYDCNCRCLWCMRFIDRFPWRDSYMTFADVEAGAKALQDAKIQVTIIKISGGEPLLHPDVFEMCRAIRETWKPTKVQLHTNGTIDRPPPTDGNWHWLRRHPAPVLTKDHLPYMISPADFGCRPRMGVRRRAPCILQKRCGVGFDTFGFSPCAQAAPISRLIKANVHSTKPVLKGCRSVCRHCVLSQGQKWRFQYQVDSRSGTIVLPTPTYQRAAKRIARHGHHQLKRLSERLQDEADGV